MNRMWKLVLRCGLCLLCFSCQTEQKSTNKNQETVYYNVTDCTEIKARLPKASSGIYFIKPRGCKNTFKVYCEMRSDGGWMVFQRRGGPGLSFERKWKAYRQGFGNLRNDHWLGLQKIRSVIQASGKSWTLRVDLWDFEGGSTFAEYKDFKLGGERESYRLHVGAYSGTAGDAIRGAYSGVDQNGFGFSTQDVDNDGCSPCIFGDIAWDDCNQLKGGGWWFSRCGSANLHGDWHAAPNNIGWASGLSWGTWKGPAPYSAKATRMMIKSG